MPSIVNYADVVAQMHLQQLVSLYPNSGAFGLPTDAPQHSVGWVIYDDATLRPAARPLMRFIRPPEVATLARLAATAWHELFPGPAWILPKAHWAYELDFGSPGWMPTLLRDIGIDPDRLSPHHDGSAIQFEPVETDAFVTLAAGLLLQLLGSDFQLFFPGRQVVCTLHHHKQIWWTSDVLALIDRLGRLAD
jgi:hypothetical protein